MYKPLQKKSSSWTPASVQKKSKSLAAGSKAIQPKRENKSSQQSEMPNYSRGASDGIMANVMRSLEAKEQEQAETQRVQPQSDSGGISVADVVKPTIQTPTPQMGTVSGMLQEHPIQRQCADCASEQLEESVAEGKDVDDMSLAASGIQAKLTVGAPGDVYEQEADRVAAQVMSMPNSSTQVQRFTAEDNPVQRLSLAQSITPVVQRQVDEQVQMQALVQRAFQAGGNETPGDLESRLNASSGGGSALSEDVRSFMEPRFGADFSGVRVHTGSEAVQMNRELGAQAFAHGSDVYFGAGKSPGNNELTAHELTHVVQQNSDKVQRRTHPSSATRLDRQTTPTNTQKTFHPIPVLAGEVSRSPVLSHLQSLTEDANHNSSVYRKEISSFQQANPPQQIRASQYQLLEQPNAVEVVQTDKSQALRRGCGCSGQKKEKIKKAAEKSQPTVDPTVALKKVAESLVEIGGTADAGDKQLVVAELIKMPLPALNALKNKGIKVVVCRNSVTEIRTDLKGVQPRGWPPGATWDSVPGLYDPNSNRVIIATRNGRIPPSGDGHGSHNLVLHEVGHAVGGTLGSASGGENDPQFLAARNQDKAKLSGYENQAGAAGVEETYAESFARFYGKDPNDATLYPNLHAYWAGNPFISDSK
ncbi:MULTISPECIES: eCIS core domain-containing protein [unclassified Coleofasciculus]|uniref:eCIS core domain-containing protein n=1 Tax=unclassified Coleofasciculus TaxID=2692782 RepID=UPI00187F7389|nr:MULTISPECIES: DUF4157 domain-containing protein [unclassified Coleofasciculus]MBE9127038.1 DUF4157 domain-containing protein [Coleofasciculus sp. LEGE 07081]MBE9147283.1 DUF4157 domain-containing protein [Coleofasciculus sp. LEGE 07092]